MDLCRAPFVTGAPSTLELVAPMKLLGDVVLKFGARGDAGERCLRFKTGHINLLVGPNDAGKSLMLREISGVNPRGNRGSFRHFDHDETRIVASVDWSNEYALALKQQIIQEFFDGDDPVSAEIKSQPWDMLVPIVERAVKDLTRLRAELSSRLLDLLKANAPGWPANLSNQSGFGLAEGGPLLIVSAVVLLVLARAGLESSKEEQPGVGVARQPAPQGGPLSVEQAQALQQMLEITWKECQTVFTSLGIDSPDMTIESLFDVKSLGGVLLKKVSEIPFLGQMIAQIPEVDQVPTPNAETIRRFERFATIGGWLLDPTPLETLLGTLRKAYEKLTWANPEQRARTAHDILYLDGLARLEMTRSVALKPFVDTAESDPPILRLLKNPDMMKYLRAMVATALGRHLVIDIATQAPQVIWRLADEAPVDGLESSFSQLANDYHSGAALLDERSDGIHAYIGMLAAILAKVSDLVFIDEPEAFLHPPLVRKLARQLVYVATEINCQFFIATHSADLLESCIAVGAEVNIIRLTHNNSRSSARLLDGAALRDLALDPLLRAESTLSALFHEGAVICEAVADRVLYREVNERLLLFDDEGGLESCVYLNAQNWQTVARMIAPLRKMGVAAAAVLDSDVLFGSELGSILEAAQVPKILRDSWLQQRGRLKEKLIKRQQPANDKIELKGHVITNFTSTEAKIFRTICSSMAEYGVFLVPVGELEDWLSDLGLKRSTDKSKWLRSALDRLGTDPKATGYARPTAHDIWQFIRDVNRWIVDPDRDGTSPTPHQED